VHGEPGIGKTSLLEYAVAEASGFRILRARPLEVESELGFAGLSEMLRPVLPLLDRLPTPLRDTTPITSLGARLALATNRDIGILPKRPSCFRLHDRRKDEDD